VPELRAVLGAEASDQLVNCNPQTGKEALKKAYRAMMTAPPDVIKKALNSILSRVSTLGEPVLGSRKGLVGVKFFIESRKEFKPNQVGGYPEDYNCL
jgi:hypothetical protein